MRKYIIIAVIAVIAAFFYATPAKATGLSVEYLHIKPSNMDFYYAQDTPWATGNVFATEHDADTGLRVKLDIGNYTFSAMKFKNDAEDTASASTGGWLYNSFGVPGWSYQSCGDPCSSVASSSIKMYVVDFTRNTNIYSNVGTKVGFAVGLRAASVKQDVVVVFDASETMTASTESKGFGIVGALNGSFALVGNLSLDANFALALLAGTSKGSYSSDWNPFFASASQDAVMPMTEASLRLKYGILKNLNIWAGYEVAHITNAASLPRGITGWPLTVKNDANIGYSAYVVGLQYILPSL